MEVGERPSTSPDLIRDTSEKGGLDTEASSHGVDRRAMPIDGGYL